MLTLTRSELLELVVRYREPPFVFLDGVRGAGKTTLGQFLAARANLTAYKFWGTLGSTEMLFDAPTDSRIVDPLHSMLYVLDYIAQVPQAWGVVIDRSYLSVLALQTELFHAVEPKVYSIATARWEAFRDLVRHEAIASRALFVLCEATFEELLQAPRNVARKIGGATLADEAGRFIQVAEYFSSQGFNVVRCQTRKA